MNASGHGSTSGDEPRAPHGRGRGRELGLWVLCHLESHPDAESKGLELFWREQPACEAADEFLAPYAEQLEALCADASARRWARRISESYVADKHELDAAIEAASKRWRLVRMDRVDRNLLRLAAVELKLESTPRNVVVSEVVRLAARYGSERSVAFVNGVAEALARNLRDRRSEG